MCMLIKYAVWFEWDIVYVKGIQLGGHSWEIPGENAREIR